MSGEGGRLLATTIFGAHSTEMARPVVPMLIAAFLVAGCGDPTSPGPAVGLFVLQTVEGASLPYTVEQDVGAFADITAGHVRLNDDGTCEASITLVDNMNALFFGTSVDPCTWSRQDAVITFIYDQVLGGEVSVDGTLIGDRLSITLEGLDLVLERS